MKKLMCGACSRVGTNDEKRLDHAPSCPRFDRMKRARERAFADLAATPTASIEAELASWDDVEHSGAIAGWLTILRAELERRAIAGWLTILRAELERRQ